MAGVSQTKLRVRTDGKSFRLGDEKFYIKGVAYGPLGPNDRGEPFASLEQTGRDFAQITELGANLVRVYNPPPRWFLDLASDYQLKVLIDIPWNKHLCFLESESERAEVRDTVRRALRKCGRHPAIFAYSLANEIPPDIVRWSGARAVERFIDELVAVAKETDPTCLCTFTNYPPTEFLRPQSLDFVCFNVYLYSRKPFENYLARLQVLAENKPLVLGEVGMDSLREGEPARCEFFNWQIESAFRCGAAGVVVFNFTDEWIRDGQQIEGWQMGLTTRDRQPKDAFWVVQKMFRTAPYFPVHRWPRVSVVVASYNGARTLGPCLESLTRLNYPDYEVILVDDGSTDATHEIARAQPKVRYLRHSSNLGLGAARNTGIEAATGEIVAFTDADCRADEDWLYHLVNVLVPGEFAGAGGPNIPPPEDSPLATVVMASPGGPAHVLLTDREAEHVPGCNMAFYKHALLAVGGFDPVFRQAGDDVDLCWRLRQAGYKIGFSPAAFVWHHRRATVREYLKQQYGYGKAEALLMRKHPEYFNPIGACTWRGRIYGTAKVGLRLSRPLIYHGKFATGLFQTLYSNLAIDPVMIFTAPEYHVFVTLPLWVLSALVHWLLPLAAVSLLISLGVCALAGAQAVLPREKIQWWSRPLVALLYLMQPIVRGFGRYEGRLRNEPLLTGPGVFEALAARNSRKPSETLSYWVEGGLARDRFVAAIVKELEKRAWPHRADIGWSEYDVEILGNRWVNLQLVTVAEEHSGGRRMFRCRLNPRLSFLAKATAFALAVLIVLAIGAGRRTTGWVWAMLVLAPGYWWFLVYQRRAMQRVGTVFMDAVAEQLGLIKVAERRQRAGHGSSAPLPETTKTAEKAGTHSGL